MLASWRLLSSFGYLWESFLPRGLRYSLLINSDNYLIIPVTYYFSSLYILCPYISCCRLAVNPRKFLTMRKFNGCTLNVPTSMVSPTHIIDVKVHVDIGIYTISVISAVLCHAKHSKIYIIKHGELEFPVCSIQYLHIDHFPVLIVTQ